VTGRLTTGKYEVTACFARVVFERVARAFLAHISRSPGHSPPERSVPVANNRKTTWLPNLSKGVTPGEFC
jgi:hypothetical protein